MNSNIRLESLMKNYRILIEEELENCLKLSGVDDNKVLEAMRYSLLNGGKRIRAIIALEACKACGKPFENAMPFACALEMVHAYSLIHDDLPCMDDDDIRRGKPSCHKKFGEAEALLTGDALLTLAFKTVADARKIPLTTESIVEAVATLADYAGIKGMIGGQVIDMELEGEQTELERVKKMYEGKTCALFKASAKLGCLAAFAPREYIDQMEKYACKLGMAFQIKDDLLDIDGDESIIGKPVGSDGENGKCTYVSLVGKEKSIEDMEGYTNAAVDALSLFADEKKANLIQLAEMLTEREK